MATIYLASPLGFSETTLGFLAELKEKLKKYDVHDPWEKGHSLLEAEADLGNDVSQGKKTSSVEEKYMQVGKANKDGIDSSDVIVAILDGSDVDSGTASEIGYAFARGKRIYGYRGDIRRAGDAEGVVVNLQVQYWIVESGGEIVEKVDDLLKALAKWALAEGEEANERTGND